MTTTTLAPRVATRRTFAAPASVGIFALLVSLVASAVPSIWYDEAATISSATRSWPELWAELHTVDAVHGVYYAGMHIVFDLIGYSPFTLRLPSAIAIGLAAAFTVVLGRQLRRPSLGLTAGIVFALLPRTTWAGGEGRSYAITAALAVIATVAFVHASRGGGRRAWIVYSALCAVSCLVFVYLALVVLAHGVAALSMRRSRARWAAAAASAGLVVSPFVLTTLGQKGQIDWLPTLDGSTLHAVVVEQWFMDQWPFAILGWLLVAVGAWTALRSRRRDDRAALLLPLVVAPTMVLLAATALAFPVYTPRYLSMSLPFVALLIAVAIDAAPWRPARLVAVAVIVTLAVPALVANRVPDSKEGVSWSSVAELVQARASSATAIVYGPVYRHPTATSRVIAYAYPQAFAGTTDVTLATSAAASGRLWESTRPLELSLDRLATVDEVLLVTSTSRDIRAQTTATLEQAGWHVTAEFSRAHVNVLEYHR